MLRGFFGNLIFAIIARMLCGNRLILLESLPDKQSSCSFSRDNKGAMHEFKLRKHRQKTNHDAETSNSDVEKSKNRRKQKMRQTTCN